MKTRPACRYWQRWLGAVLAAISGVLGECAEQPSVTSAGYAVPQTNYAFQFPRDHGSHPPFKIEWWYITGHLFTEGGRRFGFQATFFRSALHPSTLTRDAPATAFGTNHIFLAHMGLLDVASATFITEERLNRDGWDAYAKEGDLDVRNGNWTLRRQATNATDLFSLSGSVLGRAAFELQLRPDKPLVIFGQDGVSRKGAEATASSYYITYPRLNVRGRVTWDGRQEKVEGRAWMDHEISSSQLGSTQVGWDWASLQFRDGRELMVYVMRTPQGPDVHSTLAWVDGQGHVTYRQRNQFSWQPLATWRSPKTGGEYPVNILLKTTDPATQQPISFQLRPLAKDQEMVGRIGGISYWEGACDILDSQGEILGDAYLELTGYAQSLRGKLQ